MPHPSRLRAYSRRPSPPSRPDLSLENFYLFGQSWGGMLGIEYALKYQKHLKDLVISNMTASVPSYMAYANVLRSAGNSARDPGNAGRS